MSHTNATTNYQLSQFISTDTPAWMTDVNGDNQKIDQAMHSNAEAASANATAIAAAESKLTNFLPDTGNVGNVLKRTATGAAWNGLSASEIAYDPSGSAQTATNVQDAIDFATDNTIISRTVTTPTVNWSAGTIGTYCGQAIVDIEPVSGYSCIAAQVTGLSTSVSCMIGAPVMDSQSTVKCPLYRANAQAGSEFLQFRLIYKKI